LKFLYSRKVPTRHPDEKNKKPQYSKKLGKKLGKNVEMVWQWVKDGNKMVIACDFHTHE
jgi:HEPN domain-containing protein